MTNTFSVSRCAFTKPVHTLFSFCFLAPVDVSPFTSKMAARRSWRLPTPECALGSIPRSLAFYTLVGFFVKLVRSYSLQVTNMFSGLWIFLYKKKNLDINLATSILDAQAPLYCLNRFFLTVFKIHSIFLISLFGGSVFRNKMQKYN